MSFGRNPHVAKAEAEEQKAFSAKDPKALELAWREAARQWDRAADKETEGKKRTEYLARAEAARANADTKDDGPSVSTGSRDASSVAECAPADKLLIN
jgi:hypothetical protein